MNVIELMKSMTIFSLTIMVLHYGKSWEWGVICMYALYMDISTNLGSGSPLGLVIQVAIMPLKLAFLLRH